jgi:malate synthase
MRNEEWEMQGRVQVGGLSVAEPLHRFITEEALPDSGVTPSAFWAGADALIHDLAPRTRELLARRDELQAQIDEFHRSRPGAPDPEEYTSFLREIGYLVEEPEEVQATTSGVDTEVTEQAGPQLVVPLLNARFATNAANARWGSLYDALYGTDVIPETGELARGSSYNHARGAEVIARGRALLDEHFPLEGGSHADATAYAVDPEGLIVQVKDQTVRLASPDQLVGYRGAPETPEAVVLVHHGLHVEILIDRDHAIGSQDDAGVKDLVLEAAVSTIMDLEDSVAAVDAGDKVVGYRNWLRLMQGPLQADVAKEGSTFVREMSPDRSCVSLSGETVTLHGRALLFIRQVGHLMTTDAVLDRDGNEAPEGILDALVTALGSAHDLRGNTRLRNSRTGSMYAVKPKMHGPDEVTLTCEIFARVEQILGLPPQSIKVGIMDEERRTTLNLKACIEAARDRVVFINTGFLDRTGDEIHTSMHAGPMVRKNDMRHEVWIRAYEANNVDVGIACGLRGRADMLAKKGEHPRAGASCAWVPSPTAATLHAIHYHETDVFEVQQELSLRQPASRADLLTIPLGDPTAWSEEERRAELDNNVQSTLGYVVRWVDAGVGCSKVPDLGGTPLMEDRATCRISSQHVANWLLHGVVTTEQVEESLRRMAHVVDSQNDGDPSYEPMAPAFDGSAFLAARELLLAGRTQPSGYTEPILHRRRLAHKATTTRSPR